MAEKIVLEVKSDGTTYLRLHIGGGPYGASFRPEDWIGRIFGGRPARYELVEVVPPPRKVRPWAIGPRVATDDCGSVLCPDCRCLQEFWHGGPEGHKCARCGVLFGQAKPLPEPEVVDG